MKSNTRRSRKRPPSSESSHDEESDEPGVEREMSRLFQDSANTEDDEFRGSAGVCRLQDHSEGRLQQILEPTNFPDLILFCGKSLKRCEAHRVVFSVCSDYFKLLLEEEEPLKHSYVLLPDYEYDDVVNLVSFIYSGSIGLPQPQGEKLERILNELGFSEGSVLYNACRSTKVLTVDGFLESQELVDDLDSQQRSQRSSEGEEEVEKQRGRRRSKRVMARRKKKAKFERDASNNSAASDDGTGYESGAFTKINSPSFLRDTDTQDPSKLGKRFATCPECDEHMSFSAMVEHLLIKHEVEKAYFCDSCPEVFYDSSMRMDHEKSHPELITECELCDKKMTKRQMKQHKQLHKRKEDTYQCEICALTVPVYKRWQHSLVHTPNNCLTCDECGKKYFSVGSLQRHKLCHSGEEHHICHHCKRIFPTLEAKLKHGKTHTRTKMGSKCQVCGEMMNHTHFIPHLKKHGYQEMEWAGNDKMCPRCPRTFETVDLTVNHLVGHLDNPRPHECDVCFLPMRTIGLLESHKQRVHAVVITEEQEDLSPVVPCPLCKEVYEWRSGILRRHLMEHAWDILECDETDRNVTCVDCGRTFLCARYAVNHFVAHIETSRKPEFECKKCHLMEKTQTAYTHHIRRCRGEKGRVDTRRRVKTATEMPVLEEEEEENFIQKWIEPGAQKYEVQWQSDGENQLFVCNICKTSFDTEDDYSIHKQFCE